MDHETDNDRSDFASSQGAPSSPSLSLQPEEALPAYSELDARHSNNTSQAADAHGMLRAICKAMIGVYDTALSQIAQAPLAAEVWERMKARRISNRIIEVLDNLKDVIAWLHHNGCAKTAAIVVGDKSDKSDKRIADHIVENLDNLRMVINRLSPHGRAETADVVASLVVQSHRQAADHCAKPRSESKKGRKAAFQKAVAETEWRILYSALASKYPQQYKKLKNSFCLGCLIKNMGMWHSLHDAAFSSPKFLEAWAAANGQLLPKFARACTAVPCEATDDAANGYIDFSKDVIAEVKKR